MEHSIIMLCIWFFFFSIMSESSTSLDTLAASQSLHDGETLVSAGGIIEVGFFSPENTTRRYLGIWYSNVSPVTVVWVANRNKPLANTKGVLKLNEDGTLELLNDGNNTIWSSNISSKAVSNPIAHLLDSGNFVVRNGHETKDDDALWQSFDYPGDTLMAGMKIGWNLETGLETHLSSWTSVDDPAVGEYSEKIDLRGYPQSIKFKGLDIKSRAGSWNGLSLVEHPITSSQIMLEKFVINEKEVYYQYDLVDPTMFIVYKLTPSGPGQLLYWTTQRRTLQIVLIGDEDPCANYAFCGANSICSSNGSPATCECLGGYVPKSPDQWNMAVWFEGCVQRNKSNCENSYTDGFLRYTQLKLPDTSSSWFSITMNLNECRKSCLKNCSCTAYANLDIRDGGTGCLLWFNTLTDMRKFLQSTQDLYIRVPASKLDLVGHGNFKKKTVKIVVGVIIFGLVTCGCLLILKYPGTTRKLYNKRYKIRQRKEDADLPTFDLSVLANATENFSTKNKLGEGGFGPVYKGKLTDGQELAVKRLSKKSGQGLEEFKNEVSLIAKLQHRNLVKLLGCCIEGEEKMLIYEYMHNQSLDYFVFDETKRKLLDWSKRFEIIRGIGRGLLYLHQDSRLRIVHRDLKTSNILLDANLNPKISDFGLARSFFGDQVEANTNRVAGTYGYMSPEYAARGQFSVKSDIFSYGVIILEIVSGKKNREFSNPKHYNNLLGHAWTLWTKNGALELLDEVLREQFISSEVMRCIQVGLLCVQQRPEDRPDMSIVVLMLNGDKLLPNNPKVPGFYTEIDVKSEGNSSSTNHKLGSVNELSITMLDAR
ncbi:hypothetical protein Fmac_021231 [Flemingia macrophylla]|uniref:Receptor-like serine/threonine-protein kinase n=1 Tax=Flemingia macrophylla TaxID=520843 RepID=A0ABD1LWF1_9FABA